MYGDDTARLCDLAREAVAFEVADDLARCLEAVRADPDARVVRVRDSGLLSASSGGGLGGCDRCCADRSGGFRWEAGDFRKGPLLDRARAAARTQAAGLLLHGHQSPL